MEVLEGKQDVGGVEFGRVLLKPANLTQVKEEFATWAVLETEVQLALRLEGIVHLDDELVIHAFLSNLQKGAKLLQSHRQSKSDRDSNFF